MTTLGNAILGVMTLGARFELGSFVLGYTPLGTNSSSILGVATVGAMRLNLEVHT